MKNARLRHILTVVDTILSLPPDEREPYLTEVCGEDAILREEVGQLLESIRESETFWDGWEEWSQRQVHNLFQSIDAHEQDVVQEHIGPWRLVRLLGRGGMGTVWLAERADGSYEQRAAIKLLHYGREIGESASERTSSIRRFEQERQILARMDHPNIARLYDGGLTDDGRPWLAMEFIDGQPVTDWCRQHESSLKQRLHLFEEICEAVRYAHKNLIVHRDLKPENILVTEEGHVKILDFGIAKLLDEELTASQRLRTRTGIRAMSLEYAAPEQISGEPVTTATDAYSLGLLLYELLTGSYPFNLEGKNLRQIEQILRDEEPGRPSTRNDTRLRDLHGDLDAITLKALRKEPDQRYESAGHLLDDIEKYRSNLPVSARGDTFRYRAGKFYNRHRGKLAAGFIVLVGIISLISFYTYRITEERNEAQKEAAKAMVVKTFLIELFEVSDPSRSRGDTITALALLDKSATRIEALSGQPEVQATMMNAMGQVYRNLGNYDRAEMFLANALFLRRELPKPKPEQISETLHHLGILYQIKYEYEKAEPLLGEAVTLRRKHLGKAHPALASSLLEWAKVLRNQGQADSAELAYRQALTIHRQHTEENIPEVATILYGLAVVNHDQGNYVTADSLFQEAVLLYRMLPQEIDPNMAASLLALARFRHFKGNLGEAEPLYREALAMRRKLYGSEHPDVAEALTGLAMILGHRGDYDKSEPLYREALAIFKDIHGPDHSSVGITQHSLGRTLLKKGDLAEAEQALMAAKAITLDMQKEQRTLLVPIINDLANLSIKAGDILTAEDRYREALASAYEMYGKEHPFIAESLHGLGRCAHLQGKYAAAYSLYRSALEMGERVLRPDHRYIARLKKDLKQLQRDRSDVAQ